MSTTISGRIPFVRLFVATLCLLMFLLQPAESQTITVLHNFTGGPDGAFPETGLVMDRAGNIYGVAEQSNDGAGTVFKVARHGGGWTLTTLRDFTPGSDGNYDDGAFPKKLVFGPDGALYGAATFGGGIGHCGDQHSLAGCGVIFKLTPPAQFCATVQCPWTETVLYRFSGGDDGGSPSGPLVFDAAGNLYGTTIVGGTGACAIYPGVNGCGVVFKLSHSNGDWTESALYSFADSPDGYWPSGGVVLDSSGNLYGVTRYGGLANGCYGTGCGIVFEISPVGSGWTEKILYTFQGTNDSGNPVGGLAFDPSGRLIGTTTGIGYYPYDSATVFMLAPSGGNWTFAVIYSDPGNYFGGSYDNLIADASGNLYATAPLDGNQSGYYDYGKVYKLTPSNGGWTETDLYVFTGIQQYGLTPEGSVSRDTDGNLYGTTTYGGTGTCNGEGCGTLFELASH